LFDQHGYQRIAAGESAAFSEGAGNTDCGADSHYADSHYNDEMLLFYDLVTRATHRLTLSYAAINDKGQALLPSPFVTQLRQCFGETPTSQFIMPLADTLESNQAFSPTELRRVVLRQARDGNRHGLAQMVAYDHRQPVGSARPGCSMLGALQSLDSRATRDAFGPFDGLLTSDAARDTLGKRFGEDHLWSPSQLESYAACPFRFFAEQVLQAEPLEDLTLQSDVRRRGTLLHQTLATLHQQLLDTRQASEQMEVHPDEAGILQRFQAALDQTIDHLPLGGLQGVLREIERREIETWGPAYAEQDAEYRELWAGLDQPPQASFFEVRFGPSSRAAETEADENLSSPLPFQLDLGTEQIRITGQIDRIDLGRLGDVTVFNIIDYKSGKKVKLNEDHIRSGRQLQLPLYALAAEEMLLADRDAVPLAAGYWGVQETGFSANRKSPALALHEVGDGTLKISKQWNELRPQMIETIRRLVAGVRQGFFPVYNDDVKCTEWCSFKTVCRIAHVRSLEKAWVAPPEESLKEKSVEGGEG